MARRCACAILCDRLGCIRVSITPVGLGLLYMRACVCTCMRVSTLNVQESAESRTEFQSDWLLHRLHRQWVAGSPLTHGILLHATLLMGLPTGLCFANTLPRHLLSLHQHASTGHAAARGFGHDAATPPRRGPLT